MDTVTNSSKQGYLSQKWNEVSVSDQGLDVKKHNFCSFCCLLTLEFIKTYGRQIVLNYATFKKSSNMQSQELSNISSSFKWL